MSNFEKAEQLILGRTATEAAKALQSAGLLAPDLPEPYRPEIFKVASPHFDVRSVQVAGDQIVLHGYKTRHASIEESRRLALAILAAADYAEKEKENE